MIIHVHTGSLTDPAVGAHAVVNASNPAVALGSGVSAAIREACGGAAYQKEVRSRLEEEFDAELDAEDCLVTSAGTSTAFRWVLHVPAVNYRVRDTETGGSTGPRRVATCVRAALSEATSLAVANELTGRFVLAAPLLGAGHGGLGAITSLDAMLSGAQQHLKHVSLEARSALAKFVMVVLEPSDARLVELAAARHGLRFER